MPKKSLAEGREYYPARKKQNKVFKKSYKELNAATIQSGSGIQRALALNSMPDVVANDLTNAAL
jgi:hypothetical protein